MGKIKIVGKESINQLREIIKTFNQLRESVTGVAADSKNIKQLDKALKETKSITADLSKQWQVLDTTIEDSSKKKRAYKTNVSQLSAEMKRLDTTIDALEKQIRDLSNAEAVAEVKGKSLTASVKEYLKSLKETNPVLAKLNSWYKQLERESDKQAKSNERAARAQEKANAAAAKAAMPYNRLVAAQAKAKVTLQNLLVTQGKNSAQTIAAQKNYNNLTNKLNQVTAATNKYSQAAQNAKKGLFGLKSGALNLLAAFGLFQGVQLFADIARKAFSLTTQLDGMRFAMKAVIKNAEELAQTQDFLKKTTSDYGAEIVTTTNRYIKFRAAATQANFTAAETQKIFGTMTKAAGVLGLKTDELTGIYLALEQMISKGKITTEELRRQLGERLPGAMDIMADSMGVTTAQLDEMLKKGEVLTKDVLPGFADQVSIAFGLDSVDKVDTLQASVIRLQNSFTQLISDSNDASGASAKLSGVINFLAENMKFLVETLLLLTAAWLSYKTVLIANNIINGTAAVISRALASSYLNEIAAKRALILATRVETEATVTNTIAKGALSKAVTALRIRLKLLWLTMMANPVYLIAAAFAVAVVAVYAWVKATEKDYDALFKANKEKSKALVANNQLNESNIALVNRYKELEAITKKSTEQIKELNDIIALIGENMPEAVTSVDEFGNAIKLSADELDRLLQIAKEKIELELEINLNESAALLDQAEENVENYENALKGLKSTYIEGLGEVKSFNGVWYKIFKDTYTKLDAEQKLELLNYEESWKKKLKTARTSADQLIKMQAEIDYREEVDPDGSIRAAEIEAENELARLKEENQKKLHAQTVTGLQEQIDEYDRLIKDVNTEILVNRETGVTDEEIDTKNREKILVLQKEQEAVQKRVNFLLGIEEKTKGKSASKVREIRDLQYEINQLLLDRQAIELELRFNDEKLNYDIRKNALQEYLENRKSALEQAAIDEQNIVNETLAKEQKESFSKVGGGKEYNVKLAEEAADKIEAIETKLQIDLRNLEIKGKEEKASILAEQNEFTLNQIQKGYDDRITIAKQAYNEEVLINNQRIADANLIFEESDKRGKAIRERDKEVLAAKKLIAEAEKTLNNEVAKSGVEASNLVADAQIAMLEAIITALDNTDGIFDDYIKTLRAKIAEINANRVVFVTEDDTEDAIDKSRKMWEEILEQAAAFNSAMEGFMTALSDARIESINAEIVATENKYDKLIALAEGEEQQQKNLRRGKQADIEKLEKKRLKQEQKAAKMRKAFAISGIAIDTASAIMRIWSTSPDFTGLSQGILTGIISALGAVQIATVLATPIPQYKDGGNIKKNEVAMINDGGKMEYVKRGDSILSAENKNAIVNLRKNDIVYKDYDAMASKEFKIPSAAVIKDLSENDFNRLMDKISNGINKGFKGVKLQPHINITNKKSNEAYKQSLKTF